MAEFKAIRNQGEYLSDHYLSELLAKDLGGVKKRWKAAQLAKQPNSQQGLRTLGSAFHEAARVITDGLSEDDGPTRLIRLQLNADRVSAQRGLHDTVLKALAFPAESSESHEVRWRQPLTIMNQGAARAVPTALTVTGPGDSLELVAIEATWCAGFDEAVDPASGALLLDEIALEGSTTLSRAVDAVNLLTGVEDGPRYVLLLAGGIVVLADMAAWFEGKYLALDLGLALGQGDKSAGGELDTAAALFGAESLLTFEGAVGLNELVEKGRRHAVGVSKELRAGLRDSVELIAQEVVDRIHEQGADPSDLDPELPRRLTQQSLRYLYRILFLLYAESSPELGILPIKDSSYQNGYGLARLAELVSYNLPDESAAGLHYYESLALLFDLVEQGHNPLTPQERAAIDDEALGGADADPGIRFEPLRSDLFKASATDVIGRAVRVGRATVDTRLRNQVLHQVLRKLMLTSTDEKRRGDSQVGYISYAQLGINQLGAVYEGLMSYTGFFAEEDLYEVAKDGDASQGTWILPVAKAGEYGPDKDHLFVKEVDPYTGETRKRIHRKGSFVYRLSGRDRQRSASYYTPEILTEFTVRHALAELIGEDENPDNPPKMTARDILDLTVCEPALGSGAFLNEAIRQLAVAYLNRTRKEMASREVPEEFPVGPAYERELQKVKAYIALHNCYGVDLNLTAVELAEVSLWLNAMHEGMQAPWFGLHLRRGNSLIGARRAVYNKAELKVRKWLKSPPTERPLSPDAEGHTLGPDEIHHFLLPALGWGAVADAKQAKELAGAERDELAAWRKTIRLTPTHNDVKRLLALSSRVEELWALARKRLTVSEHEVRRHIDVWGLDPAAAPLDEASGAVTREDVEEALNNPEAPLARLELVMNAWCALWFWPVGRPYTPSPPTMGEWLDFLEAVLGFPIPKASARSKTAAFIAEGNTLGLFATEGDFFEALAEQDATDRSMAGCRRRLDIAQDFPWLGVVQEICERERFFHWEVRFGQVFARGGFDLQVGNPPWVRLDWDDNLALAEFDPYFGLTDKIPQKTFDARRESILVEGSAEAAAYLAEVSAMAGLTESLGSGAEHSVLTGLRTNLYMNFMERTWRSLSPRGSVGLIHPESHFVDPKAGELRAATYPRLRRHFLYRNAMQLFVEIRDTVNFSVHVYGNVKPKISFECINWLFHPATADASFADAGTDEVPGLQMPWGGWDIRPHRDRIIAVTEDVLAMWAELVDEPGTPTRQARMMRPFSRVDNEALAVLSAAGERMVDHYLVWSSALNEKTAKEDGLIEWNTDRPQDWVDVVLQGPHFTAANPFAKQPFEVCRSNNDWSAMDIVGLAQKTIPRTNYRLLAEHDVLESEQVRREEGVYLPARWRVAWRRMTASNMERGLHAALLLPGPTHIDAVHTLAMADNRSTATVAGLWSSLPLDYLVKASGKSDIRTDLAKQFPAPLSHPLTRPLLLRALRLNCLTQDYAPIWEELFDDQWLQDRWTANPSHATVSLQDVESSWGMKTPLRTDYDRRMALVEIDALVALMLGLSAEQLVAMYRSQFAVLRKYEWEMFFHPNGHKIGASTHNVGVRQTDEESKLIKEWKKAKLDKETDDIKPPACWIKPDREDEMTRAFEEFQRRLDAGEYPDLDLDDEDADVQGASEEGAD